MSTSANKATAIIPARMGSTRFPGKALAAETGMPMVVHVCQRAAEADSVGQVVVATDSTTRSPTRWSRRGSGRC
jgi:CMP-2-keto-3-deoxyoctulosonic acid synthetase